MRFLERVTNYQADACIGMLRGQEFSECYWIQTELIATRFHASLLTGLESYYAEEKRWCNQGVIKQAW